MANDSFFAVLGDDEFLVRQKAKEVFDELIKEFPDDLSREQIDGRADRVEDVERILNEARTSGQTMSLFGGGKLVWINEANFINQTRVGAAQGTKDALDMIKPFLQSLGETKLVISACPVHRGHGFVKWLQKNANYTDVAKNEKEDVAFRRLAQETADANGVSFASGALEFLAGKIGAHPQSRSSEQKHKGINQ